MSGWFYMKEGMLSDEQVGPIAAETLLQLAYDGQVKPATLVLHPTNTRGQWAQAQQIAALLKKYNEGVSVRQKEKEQKQAEKEAQSQARKAEAERQRAEAEARKREAAERIEAAQAQLPFARFLLDGQPQATVAKIFDRVSQVLTREEVVEYIAVQSKPIAIAPDCVVLTNRRFMIFRQRMLGQIDFEDYLWLHLFDAKMKEGILYGEISLRAMNGHLLSMDYLPKGQARQIYRIAQEREEAAMEERRRREMDERRSGAANIVVNTPQQATHVPAVVPATVAPAVASEDPVAKLQKLKTMLDMGLIQQSEYDETKARILSSM